MRTIINNQKKERDILLSRPYLTRHTQYDVDELLASKQIKLITGPRRTGKSTEALLMLKGRNFAYLNFDDGKLLSAWDDDLVWETLRAVYPDFEYLLLDEVQNLDGWDLWVSKLYRMGINMVITGSNAKLLSSEMATLLTGRYIQIEMLPFSLSEFFIWNHRNLSEVSEMKDSASDLSLIADYLHHGGYPETVAARSLTQNYLSTLFDSIIWKDIAKRHKVRNVEDLNNLFVKAQEALGGKIDFVLHSCAMSVNMRKKRTYDDLDYGFLDKTLDISAISFHKMLQVAKKLDALNEEASVLALTYVASHRTFFGYNDMADAKSLLESIARSFGYIYGREKKVRINTISQSPTFTTAGSGIKGFDGLYDFSDRMSPLGNASADECADYCVVMFSDLTKKVTMQTLFHDGGFSNMGMSLRGMTQYNKSFIDENRDENGNIIYG